MIENLLKKAREIIKKEQVKLIGNSESMGEQWEVKDYIVRFFKKPGRTLNTCSCPNGTKFCDSPVICSHKLAVIIFKNV